MRCQFANMNSAVFAVFMFMYVCMYVYLPESIVAISDEKETLSGLCIILRRFYIIGAERREAYS
jgi:hypothetical protein